MHWDEGEWVTCIGSNNICEANPPNPPEAPTNDPFTHEPALREYSDAEIEAINARAREVAQWGADKRTKAAFVQNVVQWAKLLAALGFVTMAGYFIGAAHRLC